MNRRHAAFTFQGLGALVLWGALVAVSMGYAARAVQAAAQVNSVFQNLQVFPNPWRSDVHLDKPIIFENLPSGSSIKIFTVSGHFARQLMADSSGAAQWDRANEAGQKVASGLYVYLISDPQGHTFTGQLAIIK